jgi:hypothetical protein
MLDLSLGNWWIWYEKVWAVVYLVPSVTKILEIYFLENTKKCYDESYMTKLEFLLEPYMLFRPAELPHICCLYCIEFCQALLILMRDLSGSWNQDHVHTTQICTTPILGVGAKTCFPFRSTQKCFTPTLGVKTKTCLIGFSSTK